VQRIIQHQRLPREAGISLLEVLMAISLLGISFATIFSGLSAALRTTDRLERFDRGNEFATKKLSELVLDPSVADGQVRSGVSPSGIAWQARTQLVDTRPLSDPKKPAQLVRIILEVSWRTRLGQQTLSLETLKLCIPEPPPSP
jgi:type II secretory pathway pseudopilin PulG